MTVKARSVAFDLIPFGLRKLLASSTFWAGTAALTASATLGIPIEHALWLFSGYAFKEGADKIGSGLAAGRK